MVRLDYLSHVQCMTVILSNDWMMGAGITFVYVSDVSLGTAKSSFRRHKKVGNEDVSGHYSRM
jgi:hypothetical protein